MKKIAVVNRTNLKNYGSVLQCYALCAAVADLGYDSEIIFQEGNLSKNFDFRPMKMLSSVFKLLTHPGLISSTVVNVKDMQSRKITDETVRLFDTFVQEEITQKKYTHRQLVRVAKSNEYAKCICGSDQIWCSTTLYVDPLMYLRFAPKTKRIAYAPSIGRDFIPRYNRRKMKKYINDIPFLSVRETEGARLIKQLTGRDAQVVLDPTLLRQKADWDKLKRAVDTPNNYVLCYFLDAPSAQTQTHIAAYAKEMGAEIVALGYALPDCENEGVTVHYPDCGPREFLSYIEGAAAVVTDSYHGMLFSILYEKQFFSIQRAYQQYDQSSRQKTVLALLDLHERAVEKDAPIPTEAVTVDYGRIKDILAVEREKSLAFLKGAIEGE